VLLMKPTSEDFKPRRDGFFEHDATWGEVTVGTLLAQRDKRTNAVWEVIATSHGAGQIEFGNTLWMRLRNVETGQEVTLPPKSKNGTCVVLTTSPLDTETAPPTDPVDTEAIMLIVEELGATLLASRDNETGQIACPDYVWESHLDKDEQQPIRRGLIEHMRFAHAMSVDDDLSYGDALILHGQAHRPDWPNIGKGGFSHVHLPEEDVTHDWVRNRKAQGVDYGAIARAKEAS
jgi:hypothetical protein